MPDATWGDADEYLTGLLHPADPVLEAALESSRVAGLPAINVSPAHGKFLSLLARSRNARRILEIGTLGGYSSIWLARALPPGGRLVTLELDPKHAAVAADNFARAGLSARIDLRIGPARPALEQMVAAREDPFDFIFIDADKPGYPDYLTLSLQLAAPGAVIVADNVVRGGAVVDAGSTDPMVQGVRRYLAMLAAEPRVDATVLQTVGVKGHDGFALALVRS